MDEIWQGVESWAEGVTQDVKDYFGGVQGGISYDTDSGLSGGVAFGERRVLSWQGLAVAALAGAVVMGILSR